MLPPSREWCASARVLSKLAGRSTERLPSPITHTPPGLAHYGTLELAHQPIVPFFAVIR